MHFVAALDRKPAMRCILGLSENVVTGAADGYARMAEKPAATLLHLGLGLANGAANLIGNGPKSPRHGAPHTFVTTAEFLAMFDLQSLRDLPELDVGTE